MQPNPIPGLLTLLSDPAALDLDEVRTKLHTAGLHWDKLRTQLALYEHELQKELRAKCDLCGGLPTCHTPDAAFALSGPALLAARREASLRFNELFFIAPSRRKN